jgi:hypothetical protein
VIEQVLLSCSSSADTTSCSLVQGAGFSVCVYVCVCVCVCVFLLFEGLEFGLRVEGVGCTVQGLGLRVEKLGFRVQG